MALAVLTVLLLVPERTEEAWEEQALVTGSQASSVNSIIHGASFHSLSIAKEWYNYLSMKLPNVAT
jgi:hypothetical protein